MTMEGGARRARETEGGGISEGCGGERSGMAGTGGATLGEDLGTKLWFPFEVSETSEGGDVRKGGAEFTSDASSTLTASEV